MPPKGWFLDGCRWRLAAQKVDVQADEVAAIDDVGDVDDAAIAVGDEAVDLGGRRVYRDVELAGDVGIGAADGQGLMGAGDLDAGQGGQKLQGRSAPAAPRRLVDEALGERPGER